MKNSLQDIVDSYGIDGYFMISCKENIKVVEPFNALIEEMKKSENLLYDSSSISLSGPNKFRFNSKKNDSEFEEKVDLRDTSSPKQRFKSTESSRKKGCNC